MKQHLTMVILAAGKGTRMGSDLAKVLHPLLGRPMLDYVITAGLELKADQLIIVTGHQAERVETHVKSAFSSAYRQQTIQFARQGEMRGTADAVWSAAELLRPHHGTTVIANGDGPLISSATLQQLVAAQKDAAAQLAVMTFRPIPPTGYGRILRDRSGKVIDIVEERDASEAQRLLPECCAGIYAADTQRLLHYVEQIMQRQLRAEFYLTDSVAIAAQLGEKVITVPTEDTMSCLGINTLEQLAAAEKLVERKLSQA